MTAGDVYLALWRHKFFILALTAVCVTAAWYATSLQERTYEASTLVRIQQRTADPGEAFAALQAAQRLARTYAKIIGSGALSGRIAARVAGQLPPDDLSKVELSAEPVEDLELLWISARSEDPARAAIVANAVPPALKNFTRSTGTLRDQIVIVKPATIPSSPAAPNTSLNVGLAFVLALVFNSGLVLLFEVLRDRLPESEELGQELGYSVLATIPPLRLRHLGAVDATTEEEAQEEAVPTFGRSRKSIATLQKAERRRSPWSENE